MIFNNFSSFASRLPKARTARLALPVATPSRHLAYGTQSVGKISGVLRSTQSGGGKATSTKITPSKTS